MGQLDQGSDHVSHVCEAARLLAVAVHSDRLARQRSAHEPRDDHAVVPDLPRPDRVEQAHDRDRQLLLRVVGQRQELVDGLRAAIAPTRFASGPEHDIVVLAEELLRSLAVDLRGRCQHDTLALFGRVLEHEFRAVDVRLDRVDRALHNELHTHRGRQVEDHVRAIDQLRQQPLVGDGVDLVVEAVRLLRFVEIADVAGGKVVHGVDLSALVQQGFAQMGANEAGSPGHEITSHGRCLLSLGGGIRFSTFDLRLPIGRPHKASHALISDLSSLISAW